jgi:hypothetical protein
MKFLAAFGLIFLYMGLWVPVLLLAISLLDDDMMSWFILGVFGFMFLTFPFVMDRIAKLVYRFPAFGAIPVSEDEMRKLLLTNDVSHTPIMVSEKGKEIVFSWKYVDTKWYEIMRKVGRSSTYRLLVKLDPVRHRATLIDLETSTDWSVGPEHFRFHVSFFRGIDVAYTREIVYGLSEALRPGKVVNYRFVPSEIKDPVMNTIRQAGWDVRFGLF